MIVGFPGETEADFEILCDFREGRAVRPAGRLRLFGRRDQRSFHLDAKVDGRTIQNRKRKLMALQRRVSKARNRKMIGQDVDVLVEGPSEETDLLWQGPHVHASARDRWPVLHQRFRQHPPPRVGEIQTNANY